MYGKNDLSKYVKNRNVDEIYSTFMDRYRSDINYGNSVLNSTAYSECRKSVGATTFKYEYQKEDIVSKVNNFKDKLMKSLDNRMDERECMLNNNVNLLNLKFKDIRTTTPIMTIKKRFVGVSNYNKRAQKMMYFSDKTIERVNPLDVFMKSKNIKKNLPIFNK
jgi:hypothetical protein